MCEDWRQSLRVTALLSVLALASFGCAVATQYVTKCPGTWEQTVPIGTSAVLLVVNVSLFVWYEANFQNHAQGAELVRQQRLQAMYVVGTFLCYVFGILSQVTGTLLTFAGINENGGDDMNIIDDDVGIDGQSCKSKLQDIVLISWVAWLVLFCVHVCAICILEI